MSVRLRRHFALLKTLTSSSQRNRTAILEECSPDFMQAVGELCINLLKGNILITDFQYKKKNKTIQGKQTDG